MCLDRLLYSQVDRHITETDGLKTRERFLSRCKTPQESTEIPTTIQTEMTTAEPGTNSSQPAQPVQKPAKMTSSGRVVRTPAYLKDYVTY